MDVSLEHLDALDGAPISLGWPAQGTVTDGFGRHWGRMHLGIDVGILTSLDVRAAAAGTVTAAGDRAGYEGYGHGVAIDIGRGYTMLNAHLAAAGSAGRLARRRRAARHRRLHGLVHASPLELRQAGVPINPWPFLG